ncbi:SDR family NAD(P)-dependent oxidoreductase [Salinisphaera aquimarina]|uniref:SDR family NAD(P)-dependent oxidoreductase n=1 Tax=Salinisphaera aquimarina TaxID=2094031 RepID=A0ABV7EMN2_9GAMM
MDRITLITGGSRGLGKSAALHLAERGHDLIITYRSQQAEAEAVVAAVEALGRRAVALPLDVGQTRSFAEFVSTVRGVLADTWQRETLDGLLNNAGMSLHEPFATTTEAQFDAIIDAHLKGPFFLTQSLLPLIADNGRILNVSSGLARFSMKGSSVYGAAKGAIEVLTRYLAAELAERGIRVNVIAPGAIATDFSGGMVRDNPEVNAFVSSITALGRPGEPEEIGSAMAMLLSEDARWINGQRIEASGGMHL